MAAPRHDLAELLKPLLPPAWKIIPYERNLDTFVGTVVMIKQSKIERLPAAPKAIHLVTFVVTVASGYTDQSRAEDNLDDLVNALIHALDENGIGWTDATKVLFDDHLAYDINLSLTSQKEQP